MIQAFCPAHITCFFQPVDAGNILSRGSRGSGIRLNLGSTVSVEENGSSSNRIVMDGKIRDAAITEKVLELMAPDRSFDVCIENGLPTGQGFGMSAAGAISAALCLSEMLGIDRIKAFEAAHSSEVIMGGGLGDVSALMCECIQPVRVKAGLPPIGCVVDSHVDLGRMTLAVLGDKMSTCRVLSNRDSYDRICEVGADVMDSYMADPTRDCLFEMSNRFSEEAGLESVQMAEAISALNGCGIRSGMCMLGNSMFIDAPIDVVSEILGEYTSLFSVVTTSEPARVIRKE